MEDIHGLVTIMVVWRKKKFDVEISSGATLKEFGQKLQNLTKVKSDTMRLLLPKTFDNSSKMLTPFSDEHSSLSLQESSILEGKSITMLGVFEDEIEEVSRNATKADLRIAGFDEEEKRLRQRMLSRPQTSVVLPKGDYIFCDFRTLHIPGLELNPPASKALRRMHTLAADPGIVAIMNKNRWRVGIMTEMAPVGYVGVSPKCILGFNTNHGEEISLRLRTDDLKGFRKYDSIKKTLLHELAHMVFSEHDANFFALNKQLNEEAASLDWTRSKSHTLNGSRGSDYFEEEYYVGENTTSSQKLGGNTSDQLGNARASSVAAAYRRFANASEDHLLTAKLDSDLKVQAEPDPDEAFIEMEHPREDESNSSFDTIIEGGEDMKTETHSRFIRNESVKSDLRINDRHAEPDPDDSERRNVALKRRNNSRPEDDPVEVEIIDIETELGKSCSEPNPADSYNLNNSHSTELAPDESQAIKTGENSTTSCGIQEEPYHDHSEVNQSDEPDPDEQELQRIQDSVTIVCNRLQKAIEILKSEINPVEATSVLQTLFKIIRNVIEHPNEIKFKRLRKANPSFQRNVANYKAAMDVLFLVGFSEDVASDEIGRSETYMVLKRNDPGLLWLAKSSLEMCITY
ncbi:hypothetical protein GIB67_032793 [Kingdonia uniflora]|uniref:WLM domain-containing protein n=1 Tax=Kingdonia uniflora TaxID=39325 RepID=A0A7J7MWC7_9MAGN|nr:hypothetical protein GIB67_032793 [Kingdonia uniflora]